MSWLVVDGDGITILLDIVIVCVGWGVDAGLDVLVAALLPQAAAMNAIATSNTERRNETFFIKPSFAIHPVYCGRMYPIFIISNCRKGVSLSCVTLANRHGR